MLYVLVSTASLIKFWFISHAQCNTFLRSPLTSVIKKDEAPNICPIAILLTADYSGGTEDSRQWSARVSKSSRHTICRHTKDHLRKIFHNLRKNLAFEQETVKFTSFNLTLLIISHFFCVLWLFRHIFMHNFFWLDILSAQ